MTRTAVLFDLDGTLTDSRPGILRTARYAFARLSEALGREVALPSDDQLDWMIGPPLRDSFAKLAGEENVETVMSFYRERYRAVGALENDVYTGVPDALDALHAAGVRLFVATSKNETDALRILTHFDLARRFEAIHGARDDGGHADKTQLIAYVLESHALEPRKAPVAMIGDRKFDIIGARNCAVTAMGALWGYGGRDELLVAGAEALLASPAEVVATVAGLAKKGR